MGKNDYNNIKIPMPTYNGKSHDSEVPDTLDIVEVAKLTINAITNRINPEQGYLMYARDNFYARPPYMNMYWANDGASSAKHLEGLVLLRIMTGSEFNLDIDKGYMESYLEHTGDDGCYYWLPDMFQNPGTPAPFDEPFGSVDHEGRLILSLCMWYQHDHNPLWKTLIEKKIVRLNTLAIHEGDFAYFTNRPNKGWEVNFTRKDTAETVKDPAGGRGRFATIQSAHQINFMLTRSLCIYYKISGYTLALDLAGKLIRGVLNHTKGFLDDGRWLIDHFHTAVASLMAFLDYALIVKDEKIITLVKRCYEYAKAAGDAVVGYFPECAGGSDTGLEHRLCESCEVADMIGLALKLTLTGIGEYWDDVEHWVRNQFVENQLTEDKLRTMMINLLVNNKTFSPSPRLEWQRKRLEESIQKAREQNIQLRIDDNLRIIAEGDVDIQKYLEPYMSGEIHKTIGTFSGWAYANDWGGFSQHACCTGNASRTIYWIWDSILTKDNDTVKVNLLLNRCSPWADVASYLPYEGKIELKVKEAINAAVRIPDWTDRSKVVCKINGTETEFGWKGNYVEINGVKPKDIVSVEFPMKTETMFRVIAGDTVYKLTIKGYTVVDIDPKGEICPLYDRSYYQKDKAPIKKTTQFISDKKIIW